MKVIISDGAVATAANTPDVIKIHQLIIWGCEGRHAVFFESPDASDACLKTIDVATRPHYKAALDRMGRTVTALPANAATVRIEPTTNPRWEDPLAVLPIDQALRVLEEPIGILVENSDNDWAFLRGLMRPSERSRISYAMAKGWAVTLHGGGHTLKAQLDARISAPEKGLRTFVMFDSDRRHPDELQPGWSPKGSEACQGFEFEMMLSPDLKKRRWMLRRRSIESYMPEQEMRRRVSANTHPEGVNAFFRMKPNARWYFNMKKGFKGDEPLENRHRCGSLYADVNAADRAALHEGFGRLADHYQQALTAEFAWDQEARNEASIAIHQLMRLI